MRVTKIIIYIIIFIVFSIQNIFSQEKFKDNNKKADKRAKTSDKNSHLEIFNKVYIKQHLIIINPLIIWI